MTTLRAKITAEAGWGCAHEASIHYRETRPIPLAAYKAHTLPLTTDCSGFATCCYYAAGAPDPNGLNYSGQGYTGTLLDHLPQVSLAQAEPADLVVFGAPPGLHVVVLLESGTANSGDPNVASHGTEAGPRVERLSAERAYFHGHPMTVLRGVADPVAKPSTHRTIITGSGLVLAKDVRYPWAWALRHRGLLAKYDSVRFQRTHR